MAISYVRNKKRESNEMRDLKFQTNYIENADGSCLVTLGNTWVVCTATIDEKVPYFIKNTGKGWITAEYGMLPRSTGERMQREAAKGSQSGRTQEIQRLISRSLRMAINLRDIGERQIIIDCDVIKADGGTRTAAINGGYIALHLALQRMIDKRMIRNMPKIKNIAAISCGIIREHPLLDLEYAEDSIACVDANFVFDGEGKIIEIQCTAEKNGFTDAQLLDVVKLARDGCEDIINKQNIAVNSEKF